MKHAVFGNHLGRDAKGAKQLYRSLMASMLTHGKVQTTRAKADVIKGDLEKLISLARKDDINNRRSAVKLLGSDLLVDRLFGNIGPGFREVSSGYTRMLKLGPRLSDSAEMVLLEFTRMPVEIPVVGVEEKVPVINGGKEEKERETKRLAGKKRANTKRKISKN